MTETHDKTAGNPALTMSDRELLLDIHRMLARVCGTLDSLGINGKVTYMDLAGIARKIRKGSPQVTNSSPYTAEVNRERS